MSCFKRYSVSIVLSILFIVFSVFKLYEIHKSSVDYNYYMFKHIEVLRFEDRLFNAKEWSLLLTNKVLNFIDNTEWAKKNIESKEYLTIAKTIYEKLVSICLEVSGLSIFVILIVLILYWNKGLKKQMSIILIPISFTFITLGVITPLIEISAYNTNLEIPIKIDFSYIINSIERSFSVFNFIDSNYYLSNIPKELSTTIVFEGKMYYYYQSKSVYDLIHTLISNGNNIVGIAILLFSIIIPFIKTIATSMLLLINKKLYTFHKIVSYIGKWSMADVFVASIFLSYLSFSDMNVGIETESNILIGLYCFLVYVILSILASTLLPTKHYSNKI